MLPVQCKMARVAAGFGVRELAEAAGVSTQTISRFERGEELKPATLAAIQIALEAAGIEFIEAGPYQSNGGPGIRIAVDAER